MSMDGGSVSELLLRLSNLDVANAVAFFASPESGWVTAQVLAVDGGWGVSEGQIPVAS